MFHAFITFVVNVYRAPEMIYWAAHIESASFAYHFFQEKQYKQEKPNEDLVAVAVLPREERPEVSAQIFASQMKGLHELELPSVEIQSSRM